MNSNSTPSSTNSERDYNSYIIDFMKNIPIKSSKNRKQPRTKQSQKTPKTKFIYPKIPKTNSKRRNAGLPRKKSKTTCSALCKLQKQKNKLYTSKSGKTYTHKKSTVIYPNGKTYAAYKLYCNKYII